MLYNVKDTKKQTKIVFTSIVDYILIVDNFCLMISIKSTDSIKSIWYVVFVLLI